MQEKEIPGVQIGKEENKILFSDNMTTYVENPKESTTKLELISLARSHNNNVNRHK